MTVPSFSVRALAPLGRIDDAALPTVATPPVEGGENARPRLLDAFCGAGGATRGYQLAGFHVTGIDNRPQPRYVGDVFIQADVFEPPIDLLTFDAIHASPPCQAYTTMNNRYGSMSLPLIGLTRELLQASGLPWVMENVAGARPHMRSPLLLHGGHFGLDVYRPRLFESNVLLMAPPSASPPKDAAAIYGRAADGRLLWRRRNGTELRCSTLERAQAAMEMPWADWNGLREAVPPAYTEWIGAQLLQHVRCVA